MEPRLNRNLFWLLALLALPFPAQTAGSFSNAFVNFESAPVHPIDLNPSRSTLALCNLPDGKLELFDAASGFPTPAASVPVGLDPVSVRFRDDTQAWVVN